VLRLLIAVDLEQKPGRQPGRRWRSGLFGQDFAWVISDELAVAADYVDVHLSVAGYL
jgi:hypothetical protein